MLFAFAESQGIARPRLFEIAGLTEDALDDPDHLVDYEPLVRVWRELLTLHPAEPLGLRYASLVSIEALGVVGYALRHARDGRQVFALYQRLSKLTDPFMRFAVEVHGEHHHVMLDHEPRVVAMVEPMEMFVVGMVNTARSLVLGDTTPTEVCFRHSRRHALALYREALGDGPSIRFGASFDGVVFPSRLLDLPLNEANPRMATYLARHAESLLETVVQSDAPIDRRVRAEIDARLLAGEADPATVARALGLSVRSLQRDLKALGTSFTAELDRARRECAITMLGRPELTVAEIAFALGYAEARVFHRSFRRWTGQTPTEFRRGK